MRLCELRLVPFGVFEDLSLLFVPGRVHLVYGPNEAGKSTCHSALAGHLFGWAKSKKDTPAVLQVRGALSRVSMRWQTEVGAPIVQATRLANQKIVEKSGHEIDAADYESRFAPYARGEFETLFALDHGALHDGGTLLGDKAGSLRDALFAAAQSGADIRRVHADLEREEGDLYRPRAKVLPVNKAIARMKKALDDARAYSSPPDTWTRAAKVVEEATAHRGALADQLAESRSEESQLSIVRKLQDVAARIAATENALDALPAATGTFAEQGADPSRTLARVTSLHESLHELRRQNGATDARVQTVVAELAAAERDASFAAHVEAAREASRAALDLSRLKDGTPDAPDSHAETEPPDESALQDLEKRLQERLRKSDEVARLTQRETELRRALERVAIGEAPPVRAAEWRVLERDAIELEARERRTGERREQHDRATRELEARAALDLEPLRRAGLPTRDEARELAAVAKEDDGEARRAESELARALTTVAALTAELERMSKQFRIPSEAELDRARAARNDLIAAGEPLTLRQAIDHTDGLVDRMRQAADRVAERSAKEDELARAELIRDQRAAEAAQLRARADATQAALRTRLARVPGDRPAVELERWASFAEQAATLWVEREELARDEAQIANARAGLEARLDAHGETLPATVARSLVAAFAERAEDSETSERQRAVSSAKRLELLESLATTTEARELAMDAARQATAQCAEASVRLSAPEHAAALEGWIRETREQRARWARVVARNEEETRRLRAIDERRTFLRERLPALGIQWDDGMSAEQVAARIDARVHEALIAQERASGLTRQLDSARAELAASRERERSDEAELTQLIAGLDADGLAADGTSLGVERALAVLTTLVRRRELDAELARERALATRLAHPLDPAPLLQRAAESSPNELDQQLAHLQLRIEGLDAELEQARRVEAQQRVNHTAMLKANHLASDALFEAETARAEAVSLATRWATAKLGVTLLQRALERYRQEHQDPVLGHASSVLAGLTEGRYVGVVPELGDGKERVRLAALRHDGTQQDAASLSEGTRDQLYLAMRFGTLMARASHGSLPLPIVLDDVFVNFDDARTRAGLSRLAELVPLTDVVYFTHHERVLELAREAVPAELLDVVRLPGPMRSE